MKKVLVIGASGMVASRVVDLLKNKYEIVPSDERTLDITKQESIDSYFEVNNFDSVVNFAAFTNVDAAEKERGDENGIVWKLNVEAPKSLARKCKEKNIFLIHISTDFIFPGTKENPGPYSEETALPENNEGIGWYGWTKNRAEKVVSESGCRYAIVRYGYPFRAAEFEMKKDWARNLLSLYNEQKMYPLFTDQVQSVIFIDDIALPLSRIIDEELPGVFHLVSTDTTTPFEIGKYLLSKYTGKDVGLEEGSILEFLKAPERTPRPVFGGLKTTITEEKLGLKLNTWREMVDEFVSQLKS